MDNEVKLPVCMCTATYKKIASIVQVLSLIIIYKCGFFTSLISNVLMSALIKWHLFINSPIKNLSRKFSLKAYLSSYLHNERSHFSFCCSPSRQVEVDSFSYQVEWVAPLRSQTVVWDRFYIIMYNSYLRIFKKKLRAS